VGRACACTVRFSDRKGVERSTEVRAASVYEAACRAWPNFKACAETEEEPYKTTGLSLRFARSRRSFTWSWKAARVVRQRAAWASDTPRKAVAEEAIGHRHLGTADSGREARAARGRGVAGEDA